MAFIISY